MSTLRSKLIRLAHERKDLRPHLLPILKEAAYTPMDDHVRRQRAEKVWDSKAKEFYNTAKRMIARHPELKMGALDKKWGPSYGWEFHIINVTERRSVMSVTFRVSPHLGPFGMTEVSFGREGMPVRGGHIARKHLFGEPFGELSNQQWRKAEKVLKDTVQDTIDSLETG